MARRPKKGKREREDRSPVRGRPVSPVEQLRAALDELQEKPDRKTRKRSRGKRRHVDDYRELVLDGTNPGGLSRALLELTRDGYSARHRLLDDSVKRVRLPAKEGAGTREDARREAARASHEIKQEMKRLGIPEDTHYYSRRERRETGEVDRTYDLESGEGRKDRDGR